MNRMSRRPEAVIGLALLGLVLTPALTLGGSKVVIDSTPADAAPPDSVVNGFADTTGALGAFWDSGQSQFVLVYPSSVTRPSSSLVASIGLPSRVQTTPVTAVDIASAKATLKELAATGALDGESWGVYFDPSSGLIDVTGSGDPSLVKSILDQLGAKGRFVPEGKSERLGGRLDDSPPFWGGARIKSPWGGCSSGFAVIRTGQHYIVTAGHCADLSATIKTATGTVEGTVTSKAIFPSRDMELYGGKAYGGYIYTGTTPGVGRNVNPTGGNPLPGVTYCTSGAYSYEQCNKTSLAVNVYHCFSDGSGCTDMMTTFTNANQLIPGDSGGPYYYNASQADARGTIIGRETNGTGYAQEWSEIQSWFNVTPCSTTTC